MEITVRKHQWLDMSTSWFVELDGEKMDGEHYSQNSAVVSAEKLAKKVGGTFNESIHNTNELFS